MRDVVKALFFNMMEKYRAVIEGEQPFLEKLEFIVFDKTEMAGQYHGEFMQTAISGDPELRQFLEPLWQREFNQMTIDFLEEGKRQGYVNPGLSQEAILLYLEIFRRGVFASSSLLANIEPNVKLFRELNFLVLYGLMGKTE